MSDYIAETFEHNGYTVEIIADSDPLNPRKEFDNAGTMVCWHSRYDLGDETRRGNVDEFLESLAEQYDDGFVNRWDNAIFTRMVPVECKAQRDAWREARTKALWKVIDANYVILPLSLLDHSGLHMWVGSGAHACDPGGWDSGQVGWIYCTREKAVEEWGKKIFTKRVREQAAKCLRSEVEEYDKYLTGDVWGYTITDPDGEEKDSCWGFFGIDYCREEAKRAVPDEPALKGGESEDEAHEEVLS